jgi:hypothetical protein
VSKNRSRGRSDSRRDGWMQGSLVSSRLISSHVISCHLLSRVESSRVGKRGRVRAIRFDSIQSSSACIPIHASVLGRGRACLGQGACVRAHEAVCIEPDSISGLGRLLWYPGAWTGAGAGAGARALRAGQGKAAAWASGDLACARFEHGEKQVGQVGMM